MEDMNLRGSITRIKIIGAMLSISGPLIAVLCKGPTIPSSASSSPSPTSFPFNSVSAGKIANKLDHRRPFTSLPNHSRRNLTKVIKMYPDEQTVTLVYFICKTIIAVPICFMAETKLSAWRLKPEMWITFITSGFFGPSFTTLLCTWGRHLKGIRCIDRSSLQGPYNCILCTFISFSITVPFLSTFFGNIKYKLDLRRPFTSFRKSSELLLVHSSETKWSAWTLRPDIELVTIVLSVSVYIKNISAKKCLYKINNVLCSELVKVYLNNLFVPGVFGPSFNTLVHTWGVHLKGPLHIAIFKPFSIAIAAAFGVIFLCRWSNYTTTWVLYCYMGKSTRRTCHVLWAREHGRLTRWEDPFVAKLKDTHLMGRPLCCKVKRARNI